MNLDCGNSLFEDNETDLLININVGRLKEGIKRVII